MLTRWLAIPLLAGLIFTAGCRSADNSKPKKLVGLSVLTMTNPFFKEIGDVFTAELALGGYEAMVVSGDDDQARQKAQVDDFLAKRRCNCPVPVQFPNGRRGDPTCQPKRGARLHR
jgi:ABC-type sugar transport system substrate-binding protein